MSSVPGDVHAVNEPEPSVRGGSDTGSAPRATYRHGDLRNALIEAGVRLAAAGGPDAVVLREATRQVGVSPNAAYRHFSDRKDLLAAVSLRCLNLVATEIMRERATASAPGDVRAQLDAVGRAYVHFALREPGLFRTAFAAHTDPEPGRGGVQGGLGPFGLLLEVLDRAVEQGVMRPGRRPGAEVAAWASVHGLAVLLLDGPLRSVPEAGREALIDTVLTTVREGLLLPVSEPRR
jgi:AcrR family transcriptional regulator